MRSLLALAAALPLAAAIDGTVINKTTGKPQAGVTVALMNLSSGMTPEGSTRTDGEGKFSFAKDISGPLLLQAAADNVTYNQMLQPETPRNGLILEVYSASAKPGQAKVAQHMVLFEPTGAQLIVRETYVYSNPENQTWNDPAGGALRFTLPKETDGKVQVMATAPRGMPLERPARKTGQAGVYKVEFPIKPGETRIDLTYQMPFTSPGKFTTRFLQKRDATMLAVPLGVTIRGAGLVEKGKEPSSQAAVYQVTGDTLAVELEGTGEMRGASTESSADEAPGIQEIPARIQERFVWIVGLTVAILALGLVLLYRNAPAEGKARERR